MTERKPRIMMDMNPIDFDRAEAEAKEQGLSVHAFARNILLNRHEKSEGDRLNEGLDQLSKAGVGITLTDQSGEPIIAIPVDMFRKFLTTDPDLIDLFLMRS